MNPFMGSSAVLMVGASAWASWKGDWKQSVIYACFAIANSVMATLKG